MHLGVGWRRTGHMLYAEVRNWETEKKRKRVKTDEDDTERERVQGVVGEGERITEFEGHLLCLLLFQPCPSLIAFGNSIAYIPISVLPNLPGSS